MRGNVDQNSSEHRHFSRSVILKIYQKKEKSDDYAVDIRSISNIFWCGFDKCCPIQTSWEKAYVAGKYLK